MVDKSVNNATIIGWVLTFILSVSGAYLAINARVYELEKQIELVKVEQNTMKIEQDNQKATLDEIRSMFEDIKTNITELKALKADKKFIQ